ncbi:MAG: hypothetical protein QUV05_10795 [Phycisphaerae bacterium]|nr:hypothetical protein [Phycisphaerae bacterium]
MRKFMLASTVVLFIVGQTMAANSRVWMELELGGSNNGATCLNRVYFTPGSTADGQYALDANGRLTWAVRVHAEGTHMDKYGVEQPIRGVANFVFDLKLYHDAVDPNNLVTTATFMSAANEVMTDCGIEQNWSNVPAGAAYLSNAAFAYVFNLNSSGPARAIDWWAADVAGHKAGGLRMDVRCYPKAAAGEGMLLGVGAGYSRWNKSVVTERSTGGLGRGDFSSIPAPDEGRPYGYLNTAEAKLTGDPVWGWLGYGPVVEGQIEGLQEGVNYILVLEPGGGINAIRDEVKVGGAIEVFAIAVDDADDVDTIAFTVVPPQEPVQILGWSSVRDCGGVAAPIALDPTLVFGTGAKFTTETRNGGVQRIMVDFNRDVSDVYVPNMVAISNDIDNDMSVVSSGLVNGGQSLQIDVTGGTDAYCYNIDITGTIPADKLAPDQQQNLDCIVQLLVGDMNGSASITATDVSFIKSKIGQMVLPDNVRFDVNCSGTLTATDMSLTKSRVGRVATCE